MKVRVVGKYFEEFIGAGTPASLSRCAVPQEKEYVVYTIDAYRDAENSEFSISYGLEDRHGRLVLYSAEMFEITDARASRYWLTGYSGNSLYLRPREFVDDVYLIEDIYEDVPGARAKFREIKKRFESESAAD